MIEAVLGEGGRFVAEVLFPLNQTGDREGCTRHPDGSVTTPSGFKEAYKQFVESGWATLSMPPEFGGQGLPHVISRSEEHTSELQSLMRISYAVFCLKKKKKNAKKSDARHTYHTAQHNHQKTNTRQPGE